ncbi:MAG: hypothetical protein R3A52_11310 [Polyangiales bacterium]
MSASSAGGTPVTRRDGASGATCRWRWATSIAVRAAKGTDPVTAS